MHKDLECVPGSMLLAIGLAGKRTVRFKLGPKHEMTEVSGDYLATNGLHVTIAHEVITKDYSLSVTFRTRAAAKSERTIGCMTSQSAVPATTDIDPKVLSEVRQELNQTMEGQAILSQQLKDALNRIAANKPRRNNQGNDVIRTKVGSASGDPKRNYGERILLV